MADGADVLVVDDTWVSGGSAQSTAAALKLAGARRVAVVVLGRHVNPADPRSAAFLESVHAAGAAGTAGQGAAPP
jgi:orotate phosphoribosyltransferase